MNAITLNLPDPVYLRAQNAALLLNRSVEEFLEATLKTALPVLEDAPSNLAAELAALATFSDAELWHAARNPMPAQDETRLHDLLDTQSERALTADEARQLESLYHLAGRLTVIKAQAYALLHQRGFSVPQP